MEILKQDLRRTGLILAVMLTGPAHAEQSRITLRHIDPHPATAAQAKHLLNRIDAAALEACGISDSSLAEIKHAARAEACWQEATGDAVRQLDSPLLTRAFVRFPSLSR